MNRTAADADWKPAIQQVGNLRYTGHAASHGANEEPGEILIAGVGNVLLTDDGIGVHAVRELQKQPIPGVVMVDIGTAILHGLDFLEAAERVLVIDAVKGGRPPGAIYSYEAKAAAQSNSIVSIHALGLLQAARLLLPGKSPPAITVLGVEPASLAYGMNLSETVRAVLPRLVSLAKETVEAWLEEMRVNFK